ncbi:MAG: 4Fe-4S binding protein [Peptococcaceae bacterium]|nr:4Fe-4S binding protein [Peptococcaceae bacterium]
MNQVTIDFERCKECGYCVNFCPRKALAIGGVINKRGYYPPVFEAEKCIACGTCARVCPEGAVEVMKMS